MSKRKTKKEVHQPDDKLFKEVMERPENAAEYVSSRFPELAKKLDLKTLQIEREKLSIPNFKTFEADIVYSCQFENSEETLNISLLWENKSEPEEHIIIQIGLYLFLRYYKMVKDDQLKLEPIIPIIFYNGKKDWIPKTLGELFSEHPFLKDFQKFLPIFDFLFTHITKVPIKELLALEEAFFRSAMIAMANKYNYDLLLQFFPVIFDLDDEDQEISISTYIFGIHERQPEQVQVDLSSLPLPIQNTIMSTLTIFKNMGQKIGEKIGEERGEERGENKKEIEVILNMHLNGFTILQISVALSKDEDFIRKVIETESKKK